MRTRYTVIALILAQATSAQLLNGSFENDADEFDLSNWAWTCDQPQAVPAAPGEGMWACSKDFGNVKGCFPSYVYQVIPDVPVDMAFTLSGWARCEPGFVQSAVGIFFGHVGTGIYPTLDTGATTNATEWTYLSLTEVFQASPLDTAAVVLNAGTVAGPAFGHQAQHLLLARGQAVERAGQSLGVEVAALNAGQQMIGDLRAHCIPLGQHGKNDAVSCFYLDNVRVRFLVSQLTCRISLFARVDDHDGEFFIDQSIRAMLHLAGRIAFGVDVADLF